MRVESDRPTNVFSGVERANRANGFSWINAAQTHELQGLLSDTEHTTPREGSISLNLLSELTPSRIPLFTLITRFDRSTQQIETIIHVTRGPISGEPNKLLQFRYSSKNGVAYHNAEMMPLRKHINDYAQPEHLFMQEVLQDLYDKGLYLISDIPAAIDVEATADAFRKQVLHRSVTKPVLVPKGQKLP